YRDDPRDLEHRHGVLLGVAVGSGAVGSRVLSVDLRTGTRRGRARDRALAVASRPGDALLGRPRARSGAANGGARSIDRRDRGARVAGALTRSSTVTQPSSGTACAPAAGSRPQRGAR